MYTPSLRCARARASYKENLIRTQRAGPLIVQPAMYLDSQLLTAMRPAIVAPIRRGQSPIMAVTAFRARTSRSAIITLPTRVSRHTTLHRAASHRIASRYARIGTRVNPLLPQNMSMGVHGCDHSDHQCAGEEAMDRSTRSPPASFTRHSLLIKHVTEVRIRFSTRR